MVKDKKEPMSRTRKWLTGIVAIILSGIAGCLVFNPSPQRNSQKQDALQAAMSNHIAAVELETELYKGSNKLLGTTDVVLHKNTNELYRIDYLLPDKVRVISSISPWVEPEDYSGGDTNIEFRLRVNGGQIWKKTGLTNNEGWINLANPRLRVYDAIPRTSETFSREYQISPWSQYDRIVLYQRILARKR